MTREESIRHFRVLEIVDLVMKINGTEASRGEEPTVFFGFSGHVGEIYVDIYENGWKRDEYPTWKKRAYLNKPEELEEIANHLIDVLQKKEKSS